MQIIIKRSRIPSKALTLDGKIITPKDMDGDEDDKYVCIDTEQLLSSTGDYYEVNHKKEWKHNIGGDIDQAMAVYDGHVKDLYLKYENEYMEQQSLLEKKRNALFGKKKKNELEMSMQKIKRRRK